MPDDGYCHCKVPVTDEDLDVDSDADLDYCWKCKRPINVETPE